MKKTIRVCNATPHRNKAVLLYDDGIYGEGFVISHNLSKSKNTFHKLRKNPNINDPRDSYISHQLRKGKIGDKELYSVKTFSDYFFDPDDENEIELMYRAKKENKPWDYYIKKACSTVESNNATTTIRFKHKHNKALSGKKSRK